MNREEVENILWVLETIYTGLLTNNLDDHIPPQLRRALSACWSYLGRCSTCGYPDRLEGDCPHCNPPV